MPQNILVHAPIALWNQHFSEALEICINENKKRNNVFIYQCKGELSSCAPNPHHKINLCKKCIKKSTKIIKKILPFAKVVNFKLNSSNIRIDTYPNTINQLMKISYRGMPVGSLVANQIADDYKDAFFNIRSCKTKITSHLTNAMKLFDNFSDFISKNNIKHVYAWNGRRPSDGPILYAAKKLGVTHTAFIRGPKPGTLEKVNDVNIFSLKHRDKVLNNLLKKINNDKSFKIKVFKEGLKFYREQSGEIKERNKLGASKVHSQFIKNYSYFFKNSKPTLILFTSSLWEKLGVEEFSNKIYLNEYSGILRIISNSSLNKKFNLIVRWHPLLKDAGLGEMGIIEKIVFSTKNKCVHIMPSDRHNSYELLKKSDIVVTFGSTIGVEATFYNKISICLGPAYYQSLDVCYYPKSHNEFLMLVNSNLIPKNKDHALIYGFYEINRDARKMINVKYRNNKWIYLGCEIFFWDRLLQSIKKNSVFLFKFLTGKNRSI